MPKEIFFLATTIMFLIPFIPQTSNDIHTDVTKCAMPHFALIILTWLIGNLGNLLLFASFLILNYLRKRNKT